METNLSIVIITDSPRQHAVAALGMDRRADGDKVRSAWSVDGALQELTAEAADAVVLDQDLPIPAWLSAQRQLRERHPDVPLLVVSSHTDESHVMLAISAGASGYLQRGVSAPTVLEAVLELKAGGAPMSREVASHVISALRRHAPMLPADGPLSDRELLLLQLLCDGHSYKSAAARMGVAMDTIRFHIRNIYQKLHVHSKAEAVSTALRSGLAN